ncbi:MAG: hypothetical protein WCD70_11480 [Alphaproteobacteria bacterium]
MDIKRLMKRARTALFGRPPVNSRDAYFDRPPVNRMNTDAVQHIQKKVQEQTDFDVGYMNTKFLHSRAQNMFYLFNMRQDVGLIMSADTPPEQVAKAEDVFISAAREKGIKIERQKIVRFSPGSMLCPNRLLQDWSQQVGYRNAPKP